MDAATEFDAVARSMVGERVSHSWRGHGSALFLEFGRLSPRTKHDGSPGHPEGEVSLGVEWSWRIEDERSILCGSWSKEEIWERGFARLRQARIRCCSLFGALPEIELVTEEGVRFLSFSTTDGQPRWHLVDRRHPPDRWFTVRERRLHLGDGSEPAV